MNKKIIIAIPVFNENKRAIETISQTLQHTKNQIIVVDDGSSDNTFALLEKKFKNNKQIILHQNVINLGKGEAMKIAVKLAWHFKAKAIIFLDGDCQHDPAFIPQFEQKILKHNLVFGYRELKQDVPLVRKLGNITARKLVERLFKIKRKDLLCGYFAFTKKVYPLIKWHSKHYGVETEIATKVGKLGLNFSEIKINTTYIDKYKGVNLFDAFKILLRIPGWYFFKTSIPK